MVTDKKKNCCPICEAGDLIELIEIQAVPVHCNLLWPVKAEAQSVARGDLLLTYCLACSHLFNAAFDEDKVTYTQAYENTLHFSPQFREYASELAAELVERYHLQGKDLVEIGSGQGDFLTLLCDLGGNRGVGFDPSNLEDEFTTVRTNVKIVPDFYSERYAHYPADFILSQHVLEHIHEPAPFIQMVRRVIGERDRITVFFEVPNSLYTLKELGIWDLIYEHISYFSPLSLRELFSRNGFNVLDLKERYGGQFLTIAASPVKNTGQNTGQPGAELEKITRTALQFAENFKQKLAAWGDRLQVMAAKKQRAVVWGAGSKGVSFINFLSSQYHVGIDYVVDINPRKRGKYTAGTGQQIIRPEELLDYKPETIIVMNPIYVSEIRQKLNELGLESNILLA